jgi:hypothetical protein
VRRKSVLGTILVVLVMIAAVVVTLLVRPSGSRPRPGPLWETRPADACSYPFTGASWDAGGPPRHSELVGDSLAGQVSGVVPVLAAQRCHTVEVWALSGAAPCDFLPGYGARLSAADPSAAPSAAALSRVVLAFVGNATSPCMLERLKQSGVIAADAIRPPATLTAAQVGAIGRWYEADLRAMIRWDLDRHLQTVLILPPAMNRGTWHGQVNDELVRRYLRIGDAYRVGTSSLARDLLGGDTYRRSVGGRLVRAADGTHLAAPVGQDLYAAAVVAAATL